MPQLSVEARARRRAGLILVGIAAVAGLVAVVATVVVAHGTGGVSSPPTAGPPPAMPSSEQREAIGEHELAARPMLALPAQAAQPQAMTTQTAGPAIALPAATQTAGRWIPGGFPASAEGAVAQLKALDETGVRGGDPQVYARAYRELSLPGAPDPSSTGLSAVLRSFRAHAGLADTGVVPGLEVTYQVTHGLIKGGTDAGRYVVVCVLGELSVGQWGRTVSAGVGDCQAMRFSGAGWRISPGELAAPAPCAWPGSADAVAAGYRELS